MNAFPKYGLKTTEKINLQLVLQVAKASNWYEYSPKTSKCINSN